MIMCDIRASGITAELNDSYFARIELRPNGGAFVTGQTCRSTPWVR